ncbi:MAG TPA: glycosyltransferase family 1 protein [Bryobacteraceae bacterium]|nr:glycosyltransferase family 1 protein [Bryobacteraceae bacterium]
MRIALDATYSLGDELSGVGVYSREILNGLALTKFAENWDWFYRSQRYFRARGLPKPPHVTQRLLSDSWGNRSAGVFHGLNQRLPKRRFRKQVVTFHDLFVLTGEYSTPEFRERFAAQAREAAAGADLVIAVSAFTASQVQEHLGVPGSRIRVIHHGVIHRPITDRPREKVVLCIGAIQRRKNQAVLIRAFRALPEDWMLVLAGSQGYEADEAVNEAANSEARERIRITGYLTDEQIGEWYARAGIFAFPSMDEGFGMPVLEAMAAGIPVVAGNRSALPEVCGGAAVLIDPRNEDELASALVSLATDQARVTALVESGRKRAMEFRWEKAVNETLTVYRELL